jgi:hypothetical protein
VAYFELPVPLEFKNATRDTIIVFNNTFTGQNYTAYPGFWPDSIKFDPDRWLVCKLDTLTITQVVNEYQELYLKITPNPVEDNLSINSNMPIPGDIDIYDVTGRICKSIKSNNQEKINIDVRDLGKGIYFIKISTQHNIISSKFVKS